LKKRSKIPRRIIGFTTWTVSQAFQPDVRLESLTYDVSENARLITGNTQLIDGAL
jgi:hypothetical protein